MPKLYNVIIFLSIIVLAVIMFVKEKEIDQLEFDYHDFKVDMQEEIKEMKYDIIDLKSKSVSNDKPENEGK